MAYLVFLVVSLILFAGFLVLTAYESRRGARYFARSREALDAEAAKVATIAAHTDLPGYVRHLLHAIAARIAHDAAHASLLFVRFLERMLTRAVRALRARTKTLIEVESGAPTSGFASTMKDFKDELRSARPPEE